MVTPSIDMYSYRIRVSSYVTIRATFSLPLKNYVKNGLRENELRYVKMDYVRNGLH